MLRSCLALLALPVLAAGECPFAGEGVPPPGHPEVRPLPGSDYVKALARLDLSAVKADISELLTSSQDFWPADFGNYGPFLIRLAWHCSGSYRTSDGRGGCDGARIRFDPERSWDDNTNLDKARALLLPIKLRYGLGLSWGDLIVLAANTAIEWMSGPVLGFCAGRIDSPDGTQSVELGPTHVQEELYPCPDQGDCQPPLGTTTVGLIYVNPEGPKGEPDPAASASQIREVFARMGMNDSETVALIGGGHAFGKTHGPCPKGAGPSPKEDPANPWPGKCGTGKGRDAFTSGFELQWTDHPTLWDNAYFMELQENEWEKYTGPGGHWQWRVKNATGWLAKVGMLTSDVALKHDPEGKYQALVELWSKDLPSLNHAFAHAWYKLTSRDMGPVTRCLGSDVPPAQPFQNPLPSAPSKLADFDHVKLAIHKVSASHPDFGGLFVRTAWRCSSTFRMTDYRGGCNGARLRFSPESTWPANAGLGMALHLLRPIKAQFGDGLSWADLIVLAGTASIEKAGGRPMRFCGGRTDAEDGRGSADLEFKVSGDTSDAASLKNAVRILGLSDREWVALSGGRYSLGNMHAEIMNGYMGSLTPNPRRLSNEYFKVLLTEQWREFVVPHTGKTQYKAVDKYLFMLKSDMVVRFDAELAAVAQEYASDNELFLSDFALTWTKLMNIDRFDGPASNPCYEAAAQDRRLGQRPDLLV